MKLRKVLSLKLLTAVIFFPLISTAQTGTCANPQQRVSYPREGAQIAATKLIVYADYSNYTGQYPQPCFVNNELGDYTISHGAYIVKGREFDLTNAPVGVYTLTGTQTLYSGQKVQITPVTFYVKDTTGPVFNKIAPEEQTEIFGTREIVADVSDPRDIKYVRFYMAYPKTYPANAVDEYTLLYEDTTYPYSISFDSTRVKDAKIRIKMIAADNNFDNQYNIPRPNISTKIVDYLVNNDNEAPTIFFYDRTIRVVSGIEKLQIYFYDKERVQSAQFYVDGTRFAALTTPGQATIELDTTKFPDGNHLITGIVTDSNNVSVQETISLVFRNYADDKPPFVDLSSHAQGQTIKDLTTLTASALDENGIDRVEFILGGQRLGVAVNEPFSVTVNTRLFANAVYELVITAWDKAGNESKKSVFLAVQNNAGQPPETTLEITSPRDGLAVAGRAEINVAALDNVAFKYVELYINDSLNSTLDLPPYKFIIDTKTFKDGAYTITVKAVDYSGAVKEDTITLNFNNSDISVAKPDSTVTNTNYKDNFKAAAVMLSEQISQITFSKSSDSPSETQMALKGTVESIAELIKKNKAEIKSEKSMQKITDLAKETVKSTKTLLKSKEQKAFNQNAKKLKALIRKLNRLFKKL